MALCGTVILAFCLSFLPQGPVDEEDFDGRRARAFESFKDGKIRESVSLLEECLQREPNDIDVLKTLGFIRYKSEDFSLSRSFFERVLDLEGTTPYILFMLANVAFREFRLGDARDLYRQTAALDSRYPALEENQNLLNEQIERVKELERLRMRCDRFYWGAIIGAIVLFLFFLGFEIKGRR